MTDPTLDANGYRDWSHPEAMTYWQAACERQRAITAATGRTPIERAMDEIDAVAKRVVFSAVEARAARFRASFAYFVAQLEIIAPGLSMVPWSKVERYLVARIDAAAEQRWVGFGGETARINMTAARIVAAEMIANETMVAAE